MYQKIYNKAFPHEISKYLKTLIYVAKKWDLGLMKSFWIAASSEKAAVQASSLSPLKFLRLCSCKHSCKYLNVSTWLELIKSVVLVICFKLMMWLYVSTIRTSMLPVVIGIWNVLHADWGTWLRPPNSFHESQQSIHQMETTVDHFWPKFKLAPYYWEALHPIIGPRSHTTPQQHNCNRVRGQAPGRLRSLSMPLPKQGYSYRLKVKSGAEEKNWKEKIKTAMLFVAKQKF